MQRPLPLLALCAAVACGGAAHPRTDVRPTTATPSVSPMRTGKPGVNLTGLWATGSAAEPTGKQLVIHPQCNVSPAVWIIQQSGDSIRAWNAPETHAQGIATTQVRPVPAEGWVSGVDVTIDSSGARYVLRYDSTSGHLRGTLNGAPFWAARLEVVQPEGCIAIP